MIAKRKESRRRRIAFVTAVCCLLAMVFGVGTDGSAYALAGERQSAFKTAAETDAATPAAFDAALAQSIGLSQLETFECAEGEWAIYSFSTTSSKAYYQVRAFVATGTAVTAQVYDATATEPVGEASLGDGEYARFALDASQTYYCVLQAAEPVSGQILISPVADDFFDERQMADTISLNQEYAVNTEIENDVDYLSFTIGDQDYTYYMVLEPTAGESGSYELEDADGQRLDEYSGTTDGSTTVKKKLTLTKNKTYYLRLTSDEAYRQVVVSITATLNRYSIQYHLNGGSNNKKNPSSYVATSTVKLKNPTRKGYLFAGWYTSAKFTGKIATIQGSAKKAYQLYAKWTKVTVGTVSSVSLSSKKKGVVAVSFQKLSGAAGYQLCIGQDAKLSKGKVYTKKSTGFSVGKLTSGKRYYAAVRAYKLDSKGKRVYGSYTKIRSVKVFDKKKSAKKSSKKKTVKKNSSKSSKKKS